MAYQPTRESPADGDDEPQRQDTTDSWGAAEGAADRLESEADAPDRQSPPGGFSEAAASEFLSRVVRDVEERER